MKAIFYAPMKSPTNPKPSGDRTVARLLVSAFQALGYDVQILEGFRAYTADPSLYGAMRRHILSKWETERTLIFSQKPDLWITYHSYYKAPDLIGPQAARALGVPYVIFEPSFSPKRRGTCWDRQVKDAQASFEQADILCPMKTKDVAPLRALPDADTKIHLLPPFVPPPLKGRPSFEAEVRTDWQSRFKISPRTPVLLCAAMMRSGKKADSYRFLARSLRYLAHLDWHLVIAGHGPEHRSIKRAFYGFEHRLSFLGQVPHNRLQKMYSAADLFVWPGLGEAYGMVYLEAAAGGTPSVAVLGHGVQEVIKDGRTGTLVPYASPKAYGDAVARLLLNTPMRRQLAKCARVFVDQERSFVTALDRLALLLPTDMRCRP